MPVKPEVQPFLDMMAAVELPLTEQTPEGLREGYAALSAIAVKEDVAAVADRSVPGPRGDVPVRVYRPAGVEGDALPILVWLHGGGWVIGDVETYDALARALANRAGAVVVSVDYRLAPEDPYPAGLEDCIAAVRWVADNAAELGGDPDRIALGGDSAGGNLTAVVAQQLRESGPALRFQLLVYPVTDARFGTASMDENAEGFFLTREAMFWFRGHYLGDDSSLIEDPRVSPLLAAADALEGLPPALVITAEYDPLRDEGEQYGQALQAAGVDTTITRYDGMIHGFFSMREMLPDAAVAVDEATEALRKAFA